MVFSIKLNKSGVKARSNMPNFVFFLVVQVGDTRLLVALIVWLPPNNSVQLDFQGLVLLDLGPVDVDQLFGDLVMVDQPLVSQVFQLG